MSTIPNEKERMKALESDEGWERSGDISFDEFFPDFEKDIGRTIRGLYLEKRTLHRSTDKKPFQVYIIRTNEKITGGENEGQYKEIAIRDYHIIKKELDKTEKGDGVKITYEGKKNKEKGEGFYHSFIIEKKLFNQNTSTDPTSDMAENDDPESVTMIEHYQELYKSNNFGNEPTAKNVIAEMEHDTDLTFEDKIRVKKQLAEMVKRNDIKE